MDKPALERQIAALRAEHACLDERIAELSAQTGTQFELARLKRIKLHLKDRIHALLDDSVPDIIA